MEPTLDHFLARLQLYMGPDEQLPICGVNVDMLLQSTDLRSRLTSATSTALISKNRPEHSRFPSPSNDSTVELRLWS
jgi:hypothetical protein